MSTTRISLFAQFLNILLKGNAKDTQNNQTNVCPVRWINYISSPQLFWLHGPVGVAGGWFHTHNLDPPHAQMKLHLSTCSAQLGTPELYDHIL